MTNEELAAHLATLEISPDRIIKEVCLSDEAALREFLADAKG